MLQLRPPRGLACGSAWAGRADTHIRMANLGGGEPESLTMMSSRKLQCTVGCTKSSVGRVASPHEACLAKPCNCPGQV